MNLDLYLGLLGFLAGSATHAPLSYTLPIPGSAMELSAIRALPQGTEPPEDIVIEVETHGEWTRFGQHRYGQEGTTRVAFLLDRVSDQEYTFYVDRNRDRRITTTERLVAEPGPDGGVRWRVDLEAAMLDASGAEFGVRRHVVYELGSTGTILGMATAGYLQGSIDLGGRRFSVRRRDADGNGHFGDATDQLWIDLNRDGEWDALDELFLNRPLLHLATGTESAPPRYALKSTRLGDELRLVEASGTGFVRLQLSTPQAQDLADAVELADVVLVGRDGSTVKAVAGPNGTELPVGEYRATSVRMRLHDPLGGQPWTYLFSALNAGSEEGWFRVGAGADVAFNPLEELEFRLWVREDVDLTQPNAIIPTQPQLYLRGRLLVRHVYRGRTPPLMSSDTVALITLIDRDGKRLDDARSGFA